MSGAYLAQRVDVLIVPLIDAYEIGVRDYFLPSFNDLDLKAKEVAAKAYRDFVYQPGFEFDAGDAADAARDMSVDFYVTMTAMRQSVLNMFAAGLFHLVEQQLASLSVDATFQAMKIDPAPADLKSAKEWYRRNFALDLLSLPEWQIIDPELRCLANAVKHAEGGSAARLRKLRPDLFVDPGLAVIGFTSSPTNRRLSLPLGGEDLFVTPEAFYRYARTAVSLFRSIEVFFLSRRLEFFPAT